MAICLPRMRSGTPVSLPRIPPRPAPLPSPNLRDNRARPSKQLWRGIMCQALTPEASGSTKGSASRKQVLVLAYLRSQWICYLTIIAENKGLRWLCILEARAESWNNIKTLDFRESGPGSMDLLSDYWYRITSASGWNKDALIWCLLQMADGVESPTSFSGSIENTTVP